MYYTIVSKYFIETFFRHNNIKTLELNDDYYFLVYTIEFYDDEIEKKLDLIEIDNFLNKLLDENKIAINLTLDEMLIVIEDIVNDIKNKD